MSPAMEGRMESHQLREAEESGAKLASALGRRWSREDSMNILRRSIPDIEALEAPAMLEAVSSLDDGGALDGEIRAGLKNLVGPNYSTDLITQVRREMCRLMMRELRDDLGLPRLETRSRCAAAVGGGDCSICLNDIHEEEEEEEGMVASLDCGHEFHARCIRRWLMQLKNVCPLCNGRAVPIDDIEYDIDAFLLALM